MLSVLVQNWWAFVARGVLAILFGLIALFQPGVTMLSLVLVFAAYAIADGVFAIIGSVHAAKSGERTGGWSSRDLEWYSWVVSNHRPSDPQSDALTN